jgi:simple sugar transport system permease protein
LTQVSAQSDEIPPPHVQPRRTVLRSGVLTLLQPEFGVAVALVASTIFFWAQAPTFVSESQWANILVVAALNGIPAIGVTYLMISGEFDLSVGATFALSPMVFSYLTAIEGWPTAPALALGLAAAVFVGATNATITAWLRIPSFIATLGMAMFLNGIELVVNGGVPIDISLTSRVTSLMNLMGGQIGSSQFFAPTLWFILVAVAAFWILRFRAYGNWVFAAGGNALAARELGIPVTSVKSLNFIVCSLLSGIAGLMQLGYVQQWNPGEGNDLELTVIVIAVVGGASLFGGVGSIIGTVIAAVFVSSLANGLVAIGAPSEWYTSFIGVILVIAVVINVRVRATAGRVRSDEPIFRRPKAEH